MNDRLRSVVRGLPLGTVLAGAALPLAAGLGPGGWPHPSLDVAVWASTFAFVISGAAVSLVVGGALGAIFALAAVRGRSLLLALAVLPIAAPPAFWWLGVTRLIPMTFTEAPAVIAGVIAGLSYAPITMLLVFTGLRQLSASHYEAARVALPPLVRRTRILIPSVQAPLVGAGLLTIVLLLGESELPFLFGFRTVMTEVVTGFAQTFDARAVFPLAAPMAAAITACSLIAAAVLDGTAFSAGRFKPGSSLRPAAPWMSLLAMGPAVGILLSLAGFALAARAPGIISQTLAAPATVAMSVAEPVFCAWTAVMIAIVAGYAARRSEAARPLAWFSLLLLSFPSAFYAIGWIRLGQQFGVVLPSPAIVHLTRGVPFAALAFLVAARQVPTTLEDAARLIWGSAWRRARQVTLPLLAAPLMAVSALVGAIAYSDRDAATLLLAPGDARLTLNLYLASANASSATIGAAALVATVGALLAVALAALGPMIVRVRRG